jgi:hypothetical protein
MQKDEERAGKQIQSAAFKFEPYSKNKEEKYSKCSDSSDNTQRVNMGLQRGKVDS